MMAAVLRVVLMSAMDFSIASDFRWVLFAPQTFMDGLYNSWAASAWQLVAMVSENDEFNPNRAEIHRRAIGRWENEGGSLDGELSSNHVATVAGKIGDAEDGNIKVRLIALENLIVALLAEAPESSELVREMARYISPRPGITPHRLTIEAARNMLALVERAAHYRDSRD